MPIKNNAPLRNLAFPVRRQSAVLDAVLRSVDEGSEEVRLYPSSQETESLAQLLRETLTTKVKILLVSDVALLLQEDSRPVTSLKTCVVLPEQDDDLPQLLHRFVDWDGGWLIAPQTARYSKNMPLFVVSIPKAGTHLLYELARRMGYQDGIELTSFAKPAHWYCLEYSNSHTTAPDFFVDSVRRAPFGNRAHPFPITPTLFIYRNPLDILVSEANYYHKDGKTSFSGYLSGLSFEQRIERLIDDPWLLGSICERVSRFLPWIEFPNVIPVSYEELVGQRGGGDDKVRTRLIWSLQLKLQVSGIPETIAAGIMDTESPTFHKGVISAYQTALSDRALAKFSELDQDFMARLGYTGATRNSCPFPPLRAEEFLHRPLTLGVIDHSLTPVTVDVCLDCNLVSYRQRFYAVPQHLGEFDVAKLASPQLKRFVSASTLSELKNKLLLGSEEYRNTLLRVAQHQAPQLLERTYSGFNLVSYKERVWAVDRLAGRLDFTDDNAVQSWLADGRLLVAGSVDGVCAGVDRLVGYRRLESSLSALRERLEAELANELKRTAEGLGALDVQIKDQRASLNDFEASLVARMESRQDAASKRSDERSSNMAARVNEIQASISGRLDVLADRIDSSLADALRHQSIRFTEMAALLEDARSVSAGDVKSLAERFEGRLGEMTLRNDDHCDRIGARLDSEMQEMAAGSATRISELEAMLGEHRKSLEDRLSVLLAAGERRQRDADLRNDERKRDAGKLAELLQQHADSANARATRLEEHLTEHLGRFNAAQSAIAKTAQEFDRQLGALREESASVASTPFVRLGRFIQRIFGK